MPDENGTIWMPNNNYFPNRNGYKPRYVVLHGTAGGSSAQEIAEYFKSTEGTTNPVSATYIVDQQAVTVQCNSENDGPYSNGYVSGKSGTSGDGYGNGFHDVWWDNGINPNLLTISIELVKSATDNSSILTPAQQQASFVLIRDICQRHNIPMRKADATGGITGHYAIDPINKARCPGVYPWSDLFIYLAGVPMTTLENFPIVSQLDSDVNAPYDCVAASIAAGLAYLTKQSYTSAQVKDAVYGASYQGNTDPQAYVNYCAQRGIQLSALTGTDNTALITTAKQQLAENHPVLFTEVDPYMPAGSGETHVVVAYACNADSITVMDPYIAAPVTKTDQQWQSDLQTNQIWSMKKSMIPTDWKDNGTVLTAPNGITVTLGFRDYVLNNNWPAGNWPLEEAHGQTPLELSNPSLGGGTAQTFRWAVLEWTPSQGVFVAWSGQELLKMRELLAQNQPETPVVTINTQAAISTVQATISALQAAIPALQSVVKDLEPS